MKTNDGNIVNEARSGRGREKNWETVLGHTGVTTWHLVTVSVIKLRIYC